MKLFLLKLQPGGSADVQTNSKAYNWNPFLNYWSGDSKAVLNKKTNAWVKQLSDQYVGADKLKNLDWNTTHPVEMLAHHIWNNKVLPNLKYVKGKVYWRDLAGLDEFLANNADAFSGISDDQELNKLLAALAFSWATTRQENLGEDHGLGLRKRGGAGEKTFTNKFKPFHYYGVRVWPGQWGGRAALVGSIPYTTYYQTDKLKPAHGQFSYTELLDDPYRFPLLEFTDYNPYNRLLSPRTTPMLVGYNKRTKQFHEVDPKSPKNAWRYLSKELDMNDLEFLTRPDDPIEGIVDDAGQPVAYMNFTVPESIAGFNPNSWTHQTLLEQRVGWPIRINSILDLFKYTPGRGWKLPPIPAQAHGGKLKIKLYKLS